MDIRRHSDLTIVLLISCPSLTLTGRNPRLFTVLCTLLWSSIACGSGPIATDEAYSSLPTTLASEIVPALLTTPSRVCLRLLLPTWAWRAATLDQDMI